MLIMCIFIKRPLFILLSSGWIYYDIPIKPTKFNSKKYLILLDFYCFNAAYQHFRCCFVVNIIIQNEMENIDSICEHNY